MSVTRSNWKPTAKTEALLLHAKELVDSVPYPVSLRWLFYRLYQEGVYSDKKDYHTKFKGIVANARHNCVFGWCQDTLVDDTRGIYWRGVGSFSEASAIDNITCNLDKLRNQRFIPFLLYEARAMHTQFSYYTKNIPLVPISGDGSIHLKYSIAKAVSFCYKKYGKPVVVLYFGDFDEKGSKIEEAARIDVTRWCSVDFEWIYCGLTEEQVKKFNLPVSVEGKGYQWEALSDSEAKSIIVSNVSKYYDPALSKPYEDLQSEIVDRWKRVLKQNLEGE